MTATDPRITELHDAALSYALGGIEVFPVDPATKAPRTRRGMKDATCDLGPIDKWWGESPDSLVAARVPIGIVVIDIDPRHGGDKVWDALVAEHGEPPVTRTHYSGRGDGGRHLWWRWEGDERPQVGGLVAWATARGLGHTLPGGKTSTGIDLLTHDHRYSILPPSPHPDTHQPYTWASVDAEEAEVAPMWGPLAELLTAAPSPTVIGVTPAPAAVEDSIADWFCGHSTWGELLGRHGWSVVLGDGESDGSQWRHPQATNSHSATVRHGCLFVYSPNTPFIETEPSDPHGYTRFHAWATLEHGGDRSSAARAARSLRDPGRAAPILVSDPAPPAQIEHAPVNLPEEFWAERPCLAHIAAAAHSRIVSRDAVLAAVLARVALSVPHHVTLPALVGAPATFDFFAGVVSRPGTGKSTSDRLADELWPIDGARVDRRPLGSGEGLIEAYLGDVEVEGDGGKKHTERRQVLDGILFHLDEGQALAEVASRSGSTLFQTLRSAWSGAHLGQANATKERTRNLPAGDYRCVLVAGFQWSTATALIEDVAGGTPQRFLWLSGEDPGIPATVAETPAWPGPLPRPVKGWTRGPVRIDSDIVDEVVQHHIDRSRGLLVEDPLDSHAMLLRLKVAMLLAVLDDARRAITVDDWRLAGVVVETSSAVRGRIAATARWEAQERARTRTQARIAEHLAIGQSEADVATERMAGAIGRHVQRGRCDEGCTRRCATQATTGKHRAAGSLEGAFAAAEQKGWIVIDGLRILSGPEVCP